MHIADHLFFLILAVVQPAVGYASFRRLVRRIEAGETVDLLHLYNTTIVLQWVLFGMTLLIWLGTGRHWPALGFGLAFDLRLLAAAALTVAAMAFLVLQLRQLGSLNAEKLHALHRGLGDVAYILPRTATELRRFDAVALTAGIVEETLWRGFMIWYLGQFMPIWAAAVISSVGFGLAHAYQGAANLPKVTLVGGAFAGLYLLAGSLWLPMILHAVVDLLQARAIYNARSSAGVNPSSAASARMRGS